MGYIYLPDEANIRAHALANTPSNFFQVSRHLTKAKGWLTISRRETNRNGENKSYQPFEVLLELSSRHIGLDQRAVEFNKPAVLTELNEHLCATTRTDASPQALSQGLHWS